MENNTLCNVLTILGCSLVGSILIWLVVDLWIWSLINKTQKNRFEEKCKVKPKELPLLAIINGIIEISLFSYAIVIGIPHLIFLWIGIKTALRWDRVNPKENKIVNNRIQRGTYFSFLIGTALSLIFSYIIACIVQKEIIVLTSVSSV